jgi:hypothetical protein
VTVYVIRHTMLGTPVLVEKNKAAARRPNAPYVSRFESYQSPIDDKTISSDRQRELDLFTSNSYDVRDIGPNHAFSKAKEARKEANAPDRSNGPEQPRFWR